MIHSNHQAPYIFRSSTKVIVAATFALCAMLVHPACAGTFTFNNFSKNPHTGIAINIPDFDPGISYPSTITLGSGLVTNVSDVNVKIFGVMHIYMNDIEILLAGPTGANVVLMRSVGGNKYITSANYTFDDQAGQDMPASSPPSPGSYRPTDYLADTIFGFLPSATPAPYGSDLSVFNGLDPTGTWRLYVQDLSIFGSGAIVDGWSITFEVERYPVSNAQKVLPAILFLLQD